MNENDVLPHLYKKKLYDIRCKNKGIFLFINKNLNFFNEIFI